MSLIFKASYLRELAITEARFGINMDQSYVEPRHSEEIDATKFLGIVTRPAL
jgi:hypothetical protein